MQNVFSTPEPVSLYVEIGSGSVRVNASAVQETTVSVEGRGADEVTVEQHGREIVVIGPRRGSGLLSWSSQDLRVHVSLPTGSDLVTKLGSADVTAGGRYGNCRLQAGSGDVRIDEIAGEASVETGSGDVVIDVVHGDLRVKSGSGDVEVGRSAGAVVVSTGSGDVTLGITEGDTAVKSGSGDLHVKDAHTDVALSTASGDLDVERIRKGSVEAKGVSGDVTVGVPAGIPVWTDISAVTGRVTSNLDGAGEPAEGQDYIEVRARTVSGDIHLEQI